MIQRTLPVLIATALLGAFCPVSHAANLFSNGSFQSGDLTDWTTVTTSNGTAGVGGAFPEVASFDVTGGGAQNAAEFQVGEVNFTGEYEGAGLTQTLDVTAGTYDISEDFAAIAPDFTNSEGGLFQILVDSVSVASFDIGRINQGSTVRNSLNDASLDLSAGSHTFEFLITRNYLAGDTPIQYITNLSLTGGSVVSAAPLPSSLWGGLMLLAGFAGQRKIRAMLA
jgi:hypothetical protein